MDVDAADSIQAFRDSARDLLGRSDQLKRLRQLRGAMPSFERSVWLKIAEAGWLSILVPEGQGGLGLGLREVTAIAEEVGRHLLPEPFVAAGVQSVAVLCQVPPSEVGTALLDQVTSGRAIAGLAWQEEAGQLEAEPCATSAVRHGEQIVISGKKQFVVPGDGVDGWIVYALEAPGRSLIWVPAGLPGIELSEERRIDATSMSCISFHDVAVPASNRLDSGESVRASIEYANDSARIAQGAELLGVARRAFEVTLEYLKTRVQFDRPIGSFQALQHRAVDVYMQIELASACIEDALGALDRRSAPIGRAASRIKARCANAALLTTRLAIQLHGAIGYTDEHDIGLFFKRALNLSSCLGGAAAHRRRALELLPSERRQADAPKAYTQFPRDADWEKMSEPEFRQMVRAFLEQHYPRHLRYRPNRVRWREIEGWYRVLSRQGWIAPAWPKAFGGMELPPDKLIAFIEEHEQYGAARPPDQGIIMLGPVLLRFGTKEQQQLYLPKILSGEHVWAQGYSEPNAGSDLAALRTEAILEGDAFVVNGQKTWTTLGQDATHMFMLVRTDKSVRKQAGISFLVVDTASPGITVRPIRNIAGDEEFCEVFFDNVLVPRHNLIGQLNQGWEIAKSLLGFERLFTGSPKQSQYALWQVTAMATARGLFSDAAFVARYAELQLDAADLSALYAHFANIVRRGEALSANVSMLKIWATETHERISMLLAEAAAEHGGGDGSTRLPGSEIHVLAPLLNALAATIFSGTNEIQRNILAKQVLGLPN
jgi:alkylation response protein AidB-like acyl-CoA dehydrogenase